MTNGSQLLFESRFVLFKVAFLFTACIKLHADALQTIFFCLLSLFVKMDLTVFSLFSP